jgi:mannan endo-1,4-beta-mannosidase
MNRTLPLLGLALLLRSPLLAQAPITITYTIDPARDTSLISPYVYGTNGQSDDRDENVTARRLGGNRLTGYNWENNASNAGTDYINHSDNYLTDPLPDSVEGNPGVAVTAFHDESLAMGAYSLITLPAAGYVAKDKNGTVQQNETAPSPRWAEAKFAKGSSFMLAPDLGDNAVYVDEEVNMLVDRYGDASMPNGIRGYAIDNEPALWPTTHPRIHPGQTTCQEVIDRGIALARGVKGVDPHAEIFGPVAYGFSEFLNCQAAPDWSSYSSYGTFINAYLAKMSDAQSADPNHLRLLDVLDLHWYPEARGTNSKGESVRIAFSEDADPGVAVARMQAPRSLWDSSYTEDSWIGQYFSPVALIPAMKSSIASRYPGTKLAFTEFNYGGEGHISGGIAVADVLGIFGREGVYMGTYWGAVDGYISSAYRIFRNYDGAKSAFGDISVGAVSSDIENSTIYGARRSADRSKLDLVVMNKNLSRPIAGSYSIAGADQYTRAKIYAFDASSSDIRLVDSIASIAGNSFTYTLPPLTVAHIVLEKGGSASGVEGVTAATSLSLEQNYPNPFPKVTVISFTLPESARTLLRVVDPLGREVARPVDGLLGSGRHAVTFDASSLAPGWYFYQLRAGGRVVTRGMNVMR